eukprot:scaffold3787_cov258-Pinguiococcus_pyrenoidosus.AAC.1
MLDLGVVQRLSEAVGESTSARLQPGGAAPELLKALAHHLPLRICTRGAQNPLQPVALEFGRVTKAPRIGFCRKSLSRTLVT